MSDSTSTLRYFVSYNGEVKGPFDLDMIEAFMLSGHYSQDIQICLEGSNEWKTHCVKLKAEPSESPAQQRQPVGAKPNGGLLKWLLVGGGTLGVSFLMWWFGPGAPPSSTYASSALSNTRVPPSNSTQVPYTSSQGRTYMVPHSESFRLSREKAALEQEDTALSTLQAGLDAKRQEVEAERAYLDRASQTQIDDFNEKVDAFNAKKLELTRRIEVFNSRIDAFNADLARVGTPTR